MKFLSPLELKNTNLYKVPCKITILSNVKSELFIICLSLIIQLANFLRNFQYFSTIFTPQT